MMTKRKSIRLVCCNVLFVLLMAACSGTATPAQPAAQQAPSASAVPATSGRGESVSLVLSDWHLTEKPWEPSIIKAVGRFKADHPNIDVQLDYVTYADKDKKYATEMAAGTGPDVVHLHAYSLRSFIERGYLLDLTPFIDQEGGEAFTKTWFPETLALTQKDKTYYGIPADYMSLGLFYNATLFKEAGLDPDKPPTTWEEFEAYAKKLTRDRDGDGKIDTWGFGTIGAIDPGFELRFSPVLYSYGADYLNADQTCSTLNTPEARKAFAFFTGLAAAEEVIPPGVTNQSAGGVRQQTASEQTAMLIDSGWTIPIMSAMNPKAREFMRVADIPVAKGTNPRYTTSAWLSVWAINKNTKNPKQAWDLIKFLTAREQEQQWFDDGRVTSSRRDVTTQYTPLLNDPVAKVLVSQLDKAKFVPQLKEWPLIVTEVNKAVQEAFTKKKAPQDALRDAHNNINTILSVYRTKGQTCPAFE